MSQQPKQLTEEVSELYDTWFYDYAQSEPDETRTLLLHEVHDDGAGDDLQEKIINLITSQSQLAVDAVLDELIEWQEYWDNQHEEPFNWYGAIKAIKTSKDHKKPFVIFHQERSNKGGTE